MTVARNRQDFTLADTDLPHFDQESIHTAHSLLAFGSSGANKALLAKKDPQIFQLLSFIRDNYPVPATYEPPVPSAGQARSTRASHQSTPRPLSNLGFPDEWASDRTHVSRAAKHILSRKEDWLRWTQAQHTPALCNKDPPHSTLADEYIPAKIEESPPVTLREALSHHQTRSSSTDSVSTTVHNPAPPPDTMSNEKILQAVEGLIARMDRQDGKLERQYKIESEKWDRQAEQNHEITQKFETLTDRFAKLELATLDRSLEHSRADRLQRAGFQAHDSKGEQSEVHRTGRNTAPRSADHEHHDCDDSQRT